MNTNTIKEFLKELKEESQPSRFIQWFAMDLIEQGYLKEIVSAVLQSTTHNEDDENHYGSLNILGLGEVEYNIATKEWYLDHFLESVDYPAGVIQTECGIDLEELTDIRYK